MNSERPHVDAAMLICAMLTASFCFFGMTSSSWAKTNSNRFCIQSLEVGKAFRENKFVGLSSYIHAPNDHHGIFFLRARDGGHPARLVGNSFQPLNGDFPTKHDYNSTIYLPTSEVLGIGGFLGNRTFYRMDADSGLFLTLQIDSTRDMSSVRDIE